MLELPPSWGYPVDRLNVLQPFALLLARLVLAVLFLVDGWPKLASGPHLPGELPGLDSPIWAAYLPGAVELIGGVLLALGLFVRIAALPLTALMIVTFFQANATLLARGWGNLLSRRLDESSLVLAVVTLLLFTTGAGKLSLDYLIFKDGA